MNLQDLLNIFSTISNNNCEQKDKELITKNENEKINCNSNIQKNCNQNYNFSSQFNNLTQNNFPPPYEKKQNFRYQESIYPKDYYETTKAENFQQEISNGNNNNLNLSSIFSFLNNPNILNVIKQLLPLLSKTNSSNNLDLFSLFNKNTSQKEKEQKHDEENLEEELIRIDDT